MKSRLDNYRVVQDMHFSRGPQSTADAVETHVHLDTPEDDGFARNVVDMGEQTFFLHALCRTDLEVRYAVRDMAQ